MIDLPSVRQAEEAREHCKACQIDVGVKRVDLAKTKSLIITQIREMVSQCDLTLKAVSLDYNRNKTTIYFGVRNVQKNDNNVCFLFFHRWRSIGSSSNRLRLCPSPSTTRLCVKMPSCTSPASATSTSSGVCLLTGLGWSRSRSILLLH